MEQLEQLKDIRGLQEISLWPPAAIWQIIAALIIIALTVGLHFYQRRQSYNRSWQKKALIRIEELKSSVDSPEIIAELFELIKQIAMARFGRQDCASLTGVKWLEWLQKNDPNGFEWLKYGRQLIEIQYAPQQSVKQALQNNKTADDLNQIINAVHAIVKNKP